MIELFSALVLMFVACWWLYSKKKEEEKIAWIPKVPGFPLIGNAWDLRSHSDRLQVLSSYSEQFDGLFYLDLGVRKIIVISDVKVLEFILTSTKMLNKSKEYGFLDKWLGKGLLTAPALRWKRSRKIITPAFHFSILRQFVQVYETNANILVKLLDKETGKESMDIFPYIKACALDIICETSMGVSINAQVDNKSDYVFAVNEMSRIVVDRSFSAIKQLDLLYPLTRDFYKERKYVKTLHSYTESVIRSRKEELKGKDLEKNPEKLKNVYEDLGVKEKVAFLDLLLQATSDGEPLPDWYIREEVDTLMFEGHDTTAAAMSFCLFCLAEHLDVQAKAVEEQRTIFGENRNRAITPEDIHEMKYLELVIKETLRLYPSVPFISRECEREIQYEDGKTFPAGVNIFLYVYGLLRNPKIFPDPEKFDPGRFEETDFSPFSYLPFSAGPRNCIGQKFAMHEMKAVISKVLRTYELVSANPKHRLQLIAELVLKSTNGIRIKLEKRNWD
ncbi:hypothetical protein NQ315_017067 [Exocentrus adspersus]|uniref:Cytochrome P450 n=1 Tax=Exocentrus adspersus TaxID=1586481 RepID=A0AAV8VGV2_9CUCU|nr:hypothetical protein NQ315_017067 [Exocentrus adspersus]